MSLEKKETNKLILLLEHLSVPERNRLKKFLASPYLVSDQRLGSLLAFMLEAPEWPSREALDEFLFPETPFSYHRIANLLSDLTQQIEAFLAWEQRKDNLVDTRLALLAQLQERGLDALIPGTVRQLNRQLTAPEVEEEQIFHQRHRLAQLQHEYFLSRERRTADQHLQQDLRAIDRRYVSSMLQVVCQWLNRQNVIESGEEAKIQERFIRMIRQTYPNYEGIPLIRGYYWVLLTLLEPQDPQHYPNLKAFLQDEELTLPPQHLKPLYQYAQNYCIKQANLGQGEFLVELFVLYQDMIAKGLILFQGRISPADVKNITTLGVRLQQFDWTEQFLNDFAEKLPPGQRENSLCYNRAYLQYGRGNLRDAMRLLNQVAFEEVFYYLGSRNLLLKIYYELNDQEGLEAMLHAFGTNLRRNKLVSRYQRAGYQAFLRLLKQLNQLRTKAVLLTPKAFAQHRARFQTRMDQTPELLNRAWLQAEVEKL